MMLLSTRTMQMIVLSIRTMQMSLLSTKINANEAAKEENDGKGGR